MDFPSPLYECHVSPSFLEKKTARFCFHSIPNSSLPFLLLQPSLEAWFVIFFTHFLIDRFAIAKYIAFAKTKIAPNKWWPSWKDCSVNGYNKDIPVWLSTWLLIITDNTIHLIINYLALKYL